MQWRRVWPLHLAFQDQRWALLCWDPEKAEPRKFLLSRMETVTSTDTQFDPPTGFDPKAYLQQSFGLFSSDTLYDVTIQFDSFSAPFIRERRWHPSQREEEQSDSTLLVHLRVNHLMDVQRWVLSWGSHAEVLAPAELRATLHTIASDLTRRYATHPSLGGS